jgi:hypothetical protein
LEQTSDRGAPERIAGSGDPRRRAGRIDGHVTALKPLCWHWHVAGGVVGGGIEGHSSEAAVLALSHEGRHRAAALINAEGKDAKMIVAIFFQGEDLPPFWYGEFVPRRSVYGSKYPRATGEQMKQALDLRYPEEPDEAPF